MSIEQTLLDAVKNSIAELYQQLAETGDVSSAKRYRLEGQCDLLLHNGLVEWQHLQDFVEQQFQQALQQKVSELFWQWCTDGQQFRLPYQTPIAPVS